MGDDVEIEIGTSILQSHHMLGVQLPPQRLASDQLKALSRGIARNKTLRRLSFAGSHMGDWALEVKKLYGVLSSMGCYHKPHA